MKLKQLRIHTFKSHLPEASCNFKRIFKYHSQCKSLNALVFIRLPVLIPVLELTGVLVQYELALEYIAPQNFSKLKHLLRFFKI